MRKRRAVTARWQNALRNIGGAKDRSPDFQWWRSRVRAVLDRFIDAERGRFILWLPVFMGAGIAAYFALRIEPPAWIGARFAAAGCAAAIAAGDRRLLRAAALSLAATALGVASAQWATFRALPVARDLPTRAVLLSGTVRAVEILPNGRRITLNEASYLAPGAATNMKLTRAARIRLKSGDTAPVATGDHVQLRAMPRAPMPPALPGGWDLQRDAFFSGLGVSGYALEPLTITARARPDGWAARTQRLREIIAARVTAVLTGSEGAIAITLLTGEQRGIPEADHAAFRNSGLAHLLAVAGLHIGIIMGFALAVTRTLMALSERISLFWPAKQIAAVCALLTGGAYMTLTGAHVPIVRGFTMACLVTAAILAGRSPVSLRGLGLAAFVLMLLSPADVPGVSFQMSFSAVLALIAGYEALRPWLRRLRGKGWRRRAVSHLVALALTSTLAGTASLPYAAYHFGRVQTWYVLSNMAAVPLAAFWVMPLGVIGLLLMPMGWEALALVPMGWGVTAIIWVARLTEALPGATLAAPHMPPWGLAVLSFGLAWLGIWRSRIRLAGLVGIAAGLASPMFDRPPDLLVSADASLIGLRTSTGVFMERHRGEQAFTRDAWFARWGVTSAAPLPALGIEGAGALRCAKGVCLFHPHLDGSLAVLVRGAPKLNGCNVAALVVSAEPARGVCSYPSPPVVDRFTVWKDGPAAVWLNPDGPIVLTDRQARGDRPWVPPRPVTRRQTGGGLPMAVSE